MSDRARLVRLGLSRSLTIHRSFEKDDDDHFKRWIKDTKRSEAVGDADAAEQLKALGEQAISTAGNEESSGVQDEDGKKKKKPAPKSKSKSDSKSKAKSTPKSNVVSAGRQDNKKKTAEDRRWELRERTHVIRRLVKELVARVRSLRYFEVVRDLQRSQLGKGTKLKVQCPAKGCEQKSLPMEDVAILSSCGHMGCYNCLLEWADRQECPTPGCQAAARASSVVRADSLGIDDEQASGRFGIKLAKVVNLIQNIPKDESILVFIQFPDLMEKVGEALKAAKVRQQTSCGRIITLTPLLPPGWLPPSDWDSEFQIDQPPEIPDWRGCERKTDQGPRASPQCR